jgi:hypothetical protein
MGYSKGVKSGSKRNKAKLYKEMSRLQRERSRYVVALKDESNNEAMDNFCLRCIKETDEAITRISEQL